MALYADEDELWKCAKHPSRRRRSGVCAACLRERLGSLCPDCAAVRPCVCCAAATTSSSSSGERLSSLIESEPAFRRSRSVAIPFLRSRSRFVGGGDRSEPASGGGRATAFWSVFRSKSKRVDEAKSVSGEDDPRRLSATTMMRRSRSVAVPVAGDLKPAAKGRSWYFPSPMKAFRQSKTTAKIEQERSPLYRG